MRRWPGIVTQEGHNRPDVTAHDLDYESDDSLLQALLNCHTRRDFISNYVEQAKILVNPYHHFITIFSFKCPHPNMTRKDSPH